MSTLSIHNAQNMATLAELRAFAAFDGGCRNFIDTVPAWASAIVRDVTHYASPFRNRYDYMVSVNARLSWPVAKSILGRIDAVGADTMKSQKAIWMLSSGSVNLERYMQVFDAPNTQPAPHSSSTFYFLDFLFKKLPTERDVDEGLDRLFQFLLTTARLIDSDPDLSAARYAATLSRLLVLNSVKQAP